MESRRAEDPRIAQLVTDVATARQKQEAMQTALDENTSITNAVQRDVHEMKETVGQVRDAIASFKTLGVVAKWVGVVSAATGSIVVAWRQIKGG